jgi:hypothetical protein
MVTQRQAFRVAKRALVERFERTYVLELLERNGMDLAAAAREAKLPIRSLRALVRRHTRPFFVERVRAFYGAGLRASEARRIADHLLSLELTAAAG